MFREKIKVLDCTIRDGGLMNNHDFDLHFVREVYKALSEAGIDYSFDSPTPEEIHKRGEPRMVEFTRIHGSRHDKLTVFVWADNVTDYEKL